MKSSLPKKFVERIRDQFREEANEFLNALEMESTTSVLLHPLKGMECFDNEKGVDWNHQGKVLAERPSFTLDPMSHSGCYYPQESSSMILDFVLHSIFGEHKKICCLDLCAAPGGKSLILSSFIGNEGLLVSNEIINQRNAVLRENLTKWGLPNFIVTANEPEKFAALTSAFDLILVDAPCSGEGMFRKDHDARTQWSEDNVKMCSVRQRRILGDVFHSIKSGGYLVYSTCTFSESENEDNCRWIHSSGLFEKVSIEVPLNWNIVNVDEPTFFALKFLPHRNSGEGFFISVFRKVNVTDKAEKRWKRSTNKFFRQLTANESKGLKKWVKQEELTFIIDKFSRIIAGSFSLETLEHFTNSLHIAQAGIVIGEMMRDDFIPAHGLAMSGMCSEVIIRVELTLENALRLLRHETLELRDAPIGWVLATYKGRNLAWLKVMERRINNYYPKQMRIRMNS